MKETATQARHIRLIDKLNAIIRLTRWREHVPYTIPLVLAGAMMAVNTTAITLDWRAGVVLIANILAMSFAFMINDLEDAPDDALDPHKRAGNVISMGILSYREGMLVTTGTFVIALVCFAFGGWKALGAGGTTLTLCYLYSARPFRLKARPVIDVISHSLMLAGLLMLSGYLIYSAYPGTAWLVIIAVTLGSAYGQFYNQLDDYETDQRAGLHNTAGLVGITGTRLLMIAALIGAVLCFALAMWLGVFPGWLGVVVLICALTLALFRFPADMRGTTTDDISGTIQQPILITANITVLLWVAAHLGLLSGIG